jgi:hypothetical protein
MNMFYTTSGLRKKYGFGYDTIHRLKEAGVLPKTKRIEGKDIFILKPRNLQTLEKLIKNRGKRILPPSMQINNMGRPKIDAKA